MRIFTAELKRFLKTRSVQITLLLGLLFAVALAYFPISFESYTYTDEDGQEVTVEGLEAIRMQRENQGSSTERSPKKSLQNPSTGGIHLKTGMREGFLTGFMTTG